MKQHLYSFLLTMLLCMSGPTAFAHDIEMKNDDGVTIYYVWTNYRTELAVSFKGKEYNSYTNEYSGNVSIPSSVTYNGSTYSVTSIGKGAFDECSNLTSVIIPNSVTSIGISAFYQCSSLTSVTIPSSVTIIGGSAFNGCSGLTTITIPNSVTIIGSSAFRNCSSLTSITIPNGVKEIDWYAFSNCSGLTSVTIPNSVTIIGNYSYSGCSSLTSIMIPNSVTIIGEGAFSGCNDLSSIIIGNSVKEIKSVVFKNCPHINDVYCYVVRHPATDKDAFDDSYPDYITLHVPEESVEQYKNVEPWSKFKDVVALKSDDPKPDDTNTSGDTDTTGGTKCDKPNIIKEGNKFWFECETPGATFKSKLTPNVEEQEQEGSEVVFQPGTITYTLTVIASAEGYEDSDPVKMTLTIGRGDVNSDGRVDVADIANIIDIMAGK